MGTGFSYDELVGYEEWLQRMNTLDVVETARRIDSITREDAYLFTDDALEARNDELSASDKLLACLTYGSTHSGAAVLPEIQREYAVMTSINLVETTNAILNEKNLEEEVRMIWIQRIELALAGIGFAAGWKAAQRLEQEKRRLENV
jgi:hypothetical protein